MIPIIKSTLRQRRWSVIWWIVGIVAFVALEMAFYPTVRDQSAQLQKSFDNLSQGTVALFSDTGDFFSPVGYLSGQIFYLMLPMLLGVLAIAAGASLIGREEREGTLELLLSRPISRNRLMLSKALCGVFIVLLVGFIGTLTTAVMAKIVSLPVPMPNILYAGAASATLAICFGSVAFMITMLGRTARTASIGAAALFAIAGYLVFSLSNSVDWLKYPAKLFPFAYYHPAEILESTYNWTNMLFLLAVIAVCVCVSWSAFRRRDIGA